MNKNSIPIKNIIPTIFKWMGFECMLLKMDIFLVSARRSSMNRNAPKIMNSNEKVKAFPRIKRTIPSIKKMAPESRWCKYFHIPDTLFFSFI